MEQSLFDMLEEGIIAYRQFGTRPMREPDRPSILDQEVPSPNDRSYVEAGERTGIPGFQLEILIDYIINDPEGTFLEQMSDILIQAKLAYDGTAISESVTEFNRRKEMYRKSYEAETEKYQEHLHRISQKNRPLDVALTKIICEAKKFDPALPFTSTMLGIVSALWKFSGSKYPGKIHPEIYPTLLKDMKWEKVDKILDIEDDKMKQELISNAKGIACQNGKEAVFYLNVPLPEVIRL